MATIERTQNEIEFGIEVRPVDLRCIGTRRRPCRRGWGTWRYARWPVDITLQPIKIPRGLVVVDPRTDERPPRPVPYVAWEEASADLHDRWRLRCGCGRVPVYRADVLADLIGTSSVAYI